MYLPHGWIDNDCFHTSYVLCLEHRPREVRQEFTKLYLKFMIIPVCINNYLNLQTWNGLKLILTLCERLLRQIILYYIQTTFDSKNWKCLWNQDNISDEIFALQSYSSSMQFKELFNQQVFSLIDMTCNILCTCCFYFKDNAGSAKSVPLVLLLHLLAKMMKQYYSMNQKLK